MRPAFGPFEGRTQALGTFYLKSLRDFKPSCLEKEFLEHAYITDKCKQWLDEVHRISAKERIVILSHVHNVTGLANICKKRLPICS